MTKNNEVTSQSVLSRRRLLGAAGLTAAGLATATSVTAAHADEADPNNDAAGNPLVDGAGRVGAQSVPAFTAGYSYFADSQFAFHSNNGNPRVITGTGVYTPSAYVVCPLHIPAGTRVREVTIFATTGTTSRSARVESNNLDASASDTPLFVTIPAGSTPATPVTVACDFTIDASQCYDLAMFTANSTERMYAFRIGAQPAAAFVPIAPYRAYDSRKAAVPNSGIMNPNTNRVISIVNAIDDAGTIITPNVIPSTARAVTYNITATLTTGDNFLAVAPGLAASTTVSAINFAANQTLANAATVSIDNGTVKVFCGGNVGSSHFIIDITGYYI